MKRSRPNLPAAVVTNQNAPVARVVPKGAKLERFGKVVLGYEHKPARISGSPGTQWTFAGQRLAELEALISYRHGGSCDTDDGELYLRAALPHLIAVALVPGTPMHRTNAILWSNRWTPRILDEVAYDWFGKIEHEFATRKRLIKADTLAKMLGVNREEREAIGLTTIGAKDWTKRQRVIAGKKRHAERQKAARATAKGYTPREVSAARSQPWLEAGFRTRRTWERHGKPPGVASSCAIAAGADKANVANSCAPKELRSNSAARSCDRPMAQPVDAVQLSLLPSQAASEDLTTLLDAWHSGPIPAVVRLEYLETMRRRSQRQEDVARTISISRPQLANALSQTFGLSADAVIRFKAWLASDEPPARPLPDRPRPPHHRRGGRLPPDPGPALPMLDAVAA